ncbi:hypothetical protein C5167_042314 [Papaver somniferum]|uniref:Uncharacterized protein n=1 Tax=Papaver somniferum TaxID=3469 RepID=A0A4Y7L6C5_PAPSO|nr:hypothetical protein C5167_042314 [Papaver somniferum]
MDSSTAKTNKQIIPIQYGQGSSIRNVTSQMLLEVCWLLSRKPAYQENMYRFILNVSIVGIEVDCSGDLWAGPEREAGKAPLRGSKLRGQQNRNVL